MLLVVTSFLLPPTAGEKITLNSICFLGIDHTYHTQHVWSSYGAPQFTNCTWSTCTLTFYALSYPNHAVKNTLFVLSYPNHGPQFAASTWSTSNQACRQWPTTCLLFSSSTQIRLDLDERWAGAKWFFHDPVLNRWLPLPSVQIIFLESKHQEMVRYYISHH